MSGLEFFEIGDRTALVCDDGPLGDYLRNAVEALDFKCHLAESADRALEQMTYVNYDLLVIAENFAGSTLDSNLVLSYVAGLPMAQRRNSYVVLVGDSFRTLDAMQAYSQSVHLVVNSGDLSNLGPILKKGLADFKLHYTMFNTVLVEIGEAG